MYDTLTDPTGLQTSVEHKIFETMDFFYFQCYGTSNCMEVL